MEKHEERDLEAAVSLALKIGVWSSAAVTLAGFLLFLFTGHSGYAGDTFPTSLTPIFQGVLALKPYALILLGLLMLILTPVFRVGVSVFLFLHEKDRVFARITALVFAILVVSFLLGRVE